MLKKRVLKRLLPLLFSFCCVFSGFLSVNAFAAIQSPILAGYVNSFEFVPVPTQSGERVLKVRFSLDSTTLASYNSVYDNVNFNYNNSFFSSVSSIYIGTDSASFDFDYIPELYDYYFYLAFHSNEIQDSFSFYPSNVRLREYTSTSTYDWVTPNYKVYHNNVDGNHKGFSVLIDVPFSNNSAVNVIRIDDTINKGSVASNIAIQGVILAFEKDTSQESVNAIVNAINNQTNQLGSDIGQAADDIQQSIEDQYSGDPETEFSVDDVISQHNEKMGVLSFGSDVMLQFLDMFQSANVGTAELTLPGFNITVENVEYSVWPDYSFNFEQLNEWVPGLMSVIRMMLPAFVWLMVLRYCIKVFEDNFLAK